MRILFMGTPDFAVSCLERIVADGHELCGVFTQPDKPVGRKQTLTPPPVKVAAQRLGKPVFQPATLRNGDAAEIVRGLHPEVIVVAAYGKILPEEILNIPSKGCINVHASLLPKYRGAAPMQWAIINGEKKTGISTMYMAKGCDTGDILLSEELAISEEETFGELHDAMAALGAQLLSRTLALAKDGTLSRKKQDDALATYAPMIDANVRAADFSLTAQHVHDLIRGLAPAPCATCELSGVPMKLLSSRVARGEPAQDAPGTAKACEDGIEVVCGSGTRLIITELQARGGRKMSACEYLRGHRDALNGGFAGANIGALRKDK